MLYIKVDEGLDKFVKIKVVGVGGAGCNALGRMAESLSGADLIGINTDSQALANCNVPIKVQIGLRITGGSGCGGDPQKGKFSANEDKEEIAKLLKGAKVCFLTTGLGGGTGTGASPIVARIAREQGALIVAVVTTPFAFEGVKRMNQAEEGLSELRENSDTLIHIPNEKLFEVADKKTTILDAFRKIDGILCQGVSSIVTLITQPGVINLDFADIRAVMENGGESMMGVGRGKGPERAVSAAKEAVTNHLLEGIEISSAKNVLVSIAGSSDLGLHEVKDAARTINSALSPMVNSIFGAVIDQSLDDEIKITVIATGLFNKKEMSPSLQKKSHSRKGKKEKEPSLFGDVETTIIDGEDRDIPAYLRKRQKEKKTEEG